MDLLPADNTEYGTKQYWDERYAREGEDSTFDWFKTYAELEPIFVEHCPDKSSRILMLGAGNSTLSEDMYRAGYHNIVNVDFSEVVIAKMRQRCPATAMPGMTWEVMDVRALALPDASFDVVIDKGTMDALMCERGDVWDPSPEIKQAVKEEVDEAVRVLKPTGKFIYVTFGQPHFRKPHLQRPGQWTLHVKTIGDAFHYYVYVAKK
ncbi:hypothetical protein H4R35_003443 [Dimargaris xerosporica]|nr:hypothetical protein H4R35_003443 [Dimargaris xerosporica]